VSSNDRVRPFQIDMPGESRQELRRRVAVPRWPDRETVSDRTQGAQLAKVQEFVGYWATDYDWRELEAKLKALPRFITEIDRLDIHFIHVRSPHADRWCHRAILDLPPVCFTRWS
jgi:Epoxide hydrolase N terminus